MHAWSREPERRVNAAGEGPPASQPGRRGSRVTPDLDRTLARRSFPPETQGTRNRQAHDLQVIILTPARRLPID